MRLRHKQATVNQFRKRNQRGSFLLLTLAFMLPVALVVGSYTLEIFHINSKRSHAQSVVDQAALLAASKLPYTQLARSAALSVLNRQGMINGAKINVTNSNVQVQYDGKHSGMLSAYTTNKFTPYRVYSSAHIHSKDVVIFMDASSYLAPKISNSIADAWQTVTRRGVVGESRHWPSAKYFINKVNRKYNNQNVPSLLLTQQCWNSGFSSLKEATIRLYDYFSSYGRNSVGVLVGPNNIENITMLRPLNSAFTTTTSPAEGLYNYFHSRYATDELCLAASEREIEHRGYQVPNKSRALPVTNFQGARTRLVNSNNVLPAINLRHLALRDTLWTMAVRREYERNNATPRQTPKIVDFREVLTTTVDAALAAPYRADRKAVSNKQSATVFLMMGDIPWVNGERLRGFSRPPTNEDNNREGPHIRELHVTRQAVVDEMEKVIKNLNIKARNAQRKVQVYINFTRHMGNYPPDLYPHCVDTSSAAWRQHPCREFVADGEALERVFRRAERQGLYSSDNLVFRVVRSPNVEGLSNNIAAWLPMIDHTILKDG